MSTYTRWTKEVLEPIVLSSLTYSECLRKMKLKIAGGNFKNLQKNIDKFNIDCSHMTYLSVCQGQEVVAFDKLTQPESIKQRLISERGRQCESCQLSLWMCKPITLELEHSDGNNRNNSRNNLKLLCPNCHSYTPTWRRRKTSKEP